MRLPGSVLSITLLAGLAFGRTQSNFDPDRNTWTLSNGLIRASFQLTAEGFFLTQQISDLQSGDQWTASPNRPASLVRLQADNDLFDAQTKYFLVTHYAESVNPGGVRQFIVLQDVNGRAQITVILDLFDDHPVLRYSLKYKNLTKATTHITWINMVPWTFDDLGKRYTAFRVNQWSVVSRPEDFQPLQNLLDTAGTAVQVYSGSDGQQCGWLALRDSDQRGLFTGWEFDGRTKTTVRQDGSKGYVQFNSTVLDLNHPVKSNSEFQVPNTFIGLFHGDWDEAGYRTQRFVESVLARPAPDSKTFPYVSWDSWAYQEKIDETDSAPQRRYCGQPGRSVVHGRSGVGAQHRGLARGSRQIPEWPGCIVRLCTFTRDEIRFALRPRRSRRVESRAAEQSRLDRHR